MKYARRRMVSSEMSVDVGGSACGDAESCAVVPAVFFLADVILSGFFAVLVDRTICRLPVFLERTGAPNSEDASLLSSAFFVFLGISINR
jgi:hypothetical protein